MKHFILLELLQNKVFFFDKNFFVSKAEFTTKKSKSLQQVCMWLSIEYASCNIFHNNFKNY